MLLLLFADRLSEGDVWKEIGRDGIGGWENEVFATKMIDRKSAL